MNCRVAVAGLFLLSTATFLFAGKVGSIVTTDGQTMTGEITETRETISIIRHGVTSVFPRDEVSSIDYSTYAERFDKSLTALAADDVDGRLSLAREAFEQREYALAQLAVDRAIDINPLNRDAMELSRAISNQIALESAKKRPPTTRQSIGKDTEPTATEKRHTRGLSPDQLNIVRQLELQSGDSVRVQFRNNARKAFVDSQPGMSFRDFNTLPDPAQALAILEKGSDELKRDVIIMNDPLSIRTFNRRLNTAIIQGCATSQCHGGPSAGDFRLLSGTPDGSTLVTNFYLLTTYRRESDDRSGSIFEASEHRMIDRGQSRESLLYQYALPRAKAKVKHPEVRDWDGIVVNDTDRFLRDLEAWMDKELAPVAPNYGFDYKVGATTKPATAPAAVEDEPVAGQEQPATQPADAAE